jgi:hypothetical protein
LTESINRPNDWRMPVSPFAKALALVPLCLLCALSARAGTSLAILDFELHDLTLLPATPEEVQRTARLRPLLEQSLTSRNHRIDNIAATTQAAAAWGTGYLADHPDAVAALADPAHTRFIVVGVLGKPSFLFSYIQARLVDVRSQQVVGNFSVEVKGQQDKITARGIDELARQIDARLRTLGATTP